MLENCETDGRKKIIGRLNLTVRNVLGGGFFSVFLVRVSSLVSFDGFTLSIKQTCCQMQSTNCNAFEFGDNKANAERSTCVCTN